MPEVTLPTTPVKLPVSCIRQVAPFVPYLAVIIGIFGLRSAWGAVFGYHLGMALVLSLDRGWRGARGLGRGMQPLHLTATGLFGFSGGVLLFLCWPLLGLPANFNLQLAGLGLSAVTWPVFLIYFCAVNPIMEEVYWRGYLGDASRRPVWNDLLFAGYHLLVLAPFVWWPWLGVALVALFSAGWLWRQQARLTNGLLVPLVSHGIADLAIMLTVYLYVLKG